MDYLYILSISDLIIAPIILFIAIIFSRIYANTKVENQPEYRYYTSGLIAKIAGGLGLCIVYLFYYNGGDTIGYFEDSTFLVNMAFKDFKTFLSVLSGNLSRENYSVFDAETGYPSSFWRDKNAYFVVRLITPLTFLTLKSYLGTTILLAWIAYIGIWKMYRIFCSEFPSLRRELAYAILFIPSVLFWGSGILKDTITFSAVCWYTFAFYCFFVRRKFKISHFLQLSVSVFFILAVKPYIFYALIPGSVIWVAFSYIKKIPYKIQKYLMAPLVIAVLSACGYFLLLQMSTSFGKFSIDKAIENAVIIQKDLKQNYYGGNTFDIGDLDASLEGLMSKAHIAVASGLFRPFIWEARNPVMLLSALEGTVFIFLSLNILMAPRRFLRMLPDHPLLVYSLIFVLFFAFCVGITTSNFGSLVRYRIPAIPFFVSVLVIFRGLSKYSRENKGAEKK
jgi:hypothetical protein